MANVVVIYNTVTGFSRTFGEWIAEELGAELVPCAESKRLDLPSYDLIIYGAGVRMSAMRGFSDFRKQLKAAGLEDSGEGYRVGQWRHPTDSRARLEGSCEHLHQGGTGEEPLPVLLL